MSNITTSRLVLILGLAACLLATGCESRRGSALATSPTVMPIAASDPRSGERPSASFEVRNVPARLARPYSLEAVSDLSPFQAGLREGYKQDVASLPLATSYRIDARLYESSRQVSARQEVRYGNRTARSLGEIYLRLLPNQPGQQGSLTVDAVAVPGRRAGWALAVDATVLRIEIEPPLLPGEFVRLMLEYRVQVPEDNPAGFGIFTYQNGVFSLDHFYPWIPVCDEEGWHLDAWNELGDPTYTDVAFYDVALTAPTEMCVVGSGFVASVHSNADGSKTTRFLAGPMRDFQLVAARGLKSIEGEADGIRVVSYYLGDHDEEGRRVLQYAIAALRIYERRFGPYPYAELSLVEAPIRAVGMEYPGLVLIGSRVYRPAEGSHDLSLEFSVAHEVAHQWWYGLVGSDQQGEPWLDEALANYASILYFEELYGPERAKAEMEGALWSAYWLAMALGQDAPVRQPVGGFTKRNYYAIVYAKGALFFDALRQEVGDAVFDRILRAYYQEFRYRNARSDDLMRIADREAGRSLADLYAAWQVSAAPVDLWAAAPARPALLPADQAAAPAGRP